MARLPLEGIRVLEPGMIWAAPDSTEHLAAMGAEVIKIESLVRSERWTRGTPMGAFNQINRNKLDITLDLRKPQGAELFKRLVKISDVIVENYSPRVMKNFGLDYPVLKEVKPDIIMVSASGFGQWGQWGNYMGYGVLIEAASGLMDLTGYANDVPSRPTGTVAYSDLVVSYDIAFAVLTALHYRQRTGKGQWIDLSQYEAFIAHHGEALMDYAMNGNVQKRIGNRDQSMAPHGCYQCKGNDKWVAIAVSSDEEWQALCNALDNPPWTLEERFSDSLSRWQNQEDLDKLIEEWTSPREHYEVMHILQAVGVPAGAVLSAKDLLMDPHMKERGFWQQVTHPGDAEGDVPRLYLGPVVRLSKTPGSLLRPAPTLGRDNDLVLRGHLGLADEEIAKLAEEEVIGTEAPGVEETMLPIPPQLRLMMGQLVEYDENYLELLDLK